MILILLAVSLVIAVAVIAFNLAVYAMPLMAGVGAFRLAYAAGGGLILAVFAAGAAAVISIAVVVLGMGLARSSTLRLLMAAIYVTPAIVAGYALIHGIGKHAIEPALGLQVVAGMGGAIIGGAAFSSLLGAASRHHE
jgi:hypothetical protein